jgi:hypothetical protein
MLRAVLCGCRTRSLTVREYWRLRGYDNRVIRGVFRNVREKCNSGLKKTHCWKTSWFSLFTKHFYSDKIKGKGVKRAVHVNSLTTRNGGACGERRHSSYSFLTSVLDGMSGQRHAPTTLYRRGKDPRCPLDSRLGGPQSRCGHRGWEMNKNFWK